MTSDPIVVTFLRRLLDLDANQAVLPQVVDESLRLLAHLTEARAAYVELFDTHNKPLFARMHGTHEEQSRVRALLFREPLASAVLGGRTITAVAGASADAAKRGPSILCVPIGHETAVGVVYLESKRADRPFTSLDIAHAETFARRVADVADALVPPRKLVQQLDDFKRKLIRRELRRNDWNKSSTARSLGVGRAALYRALRPK